MKLKELFTERNGKISLMHVMSALCCLTAIGIAIYGISKPAPDYSGMSLLCGTFLTAAMGGKIMYKKMDMATNPVEK